ncbi:MAG: hypothetical protein U5R46_01320 [Gammaproteobacteria bacterium]|nr:hypothetical protein [Gammaproteobacteria bacterium]
MITGVLLVAVSGCEKGSAEKVGESIDESVEKIGKSIKETGESIQDAGRAAGD